MSVCGMQIGYLAKADVMPSRPCASRGIQHTHIYIQTYICVRVCVCVFANLLLRKVTQKGKNQKSRIRTDNLMSHWSR